MDVQDAAPDHSFPLCCCYTGRTPFDLNLTYSWAVPGRGFGCNDHRNVMEISTCAVLCLLWLVRRVNESHAGLVLVCLRTIGNNSRFQTFKQSDMLVCYLIRQRGTLMRSLELSHTSCPVSPGSLSSGAVCASTAEQLLQRRLVRAVMCMWQLENGSADQTSCVWVSKASEM